jgi:Flp pilus assembly pilin Flp
MSERVVHHVRRGAIGIGGGAGSARGQGLVEYVLILSLIAIVAMVALTFFGSQLSDLLSTIAGQINP